MVLKLKTKSKNVTVFCVNFVITVHKPCWHFQPNFFQPLEVGVLTEMADSRINRPSAVGQFGKIFY